MLRLFLVGQGDDGSAAMAGHIGGVQEIINAEYPNLIFNDPNDVSEVRNVAGTTKNIIIF